MNIITYKERKLLEKLLNNSMKIRAIGRQIGRGHTTLLYEIRTHSGDHLPYDADRAQALYEKAQMRKGNISKLLSNPSLWKYVLQKLQEDFSPEQIAGRLKTCSEEKEKARGSVSHETIYAFIYAEENKKHQYWKYLMRHRKKRRKRGTRKSRKGGTLKNITSISKRPRFIEQRQEEGHWESDSMIFRKQKEILSVQVERKTRVVRLTKCKNKTAAETTRAVQGALGGEVSDFLKSITFDRGTEGAGHEEIASYLSVDIFFCHPYCSWEKGSVENRNMFIRRYLPRDTDMSQMSDEKIYEIQEKLNNRPMKCLGYRSPNEMMFYERFGRFPPSNTSPVFPRSGQVKA